MTGAWEAGFEQIRPATTRREPPEDPREALQAAIWEALRGLQARTGGRPRATVAADLMAICDQTVAAGREDLRELARTWQSAAETHADRARLLSRPPALPATRAAENRHAVALRECAQQLADLIGDQP